MDGGFVIIKKLEVGPVMANCYVLGCEKTKDAVVIDPGDETSRILLALADAKLKLKYILNTHGHFDHVGGNKAMKAATGADILIHPSDAPMLQHLTMTSAMFGLHVDNSPPADRLIKDGDEIQFGEFTVKVIHTPGHTPGGVTFQIGKRLFAGDTLFAGSIGRTDLPGGHFNTLISSIKDKLFTFDDDTEVYTGHGPETTIGNEKRYNPFL
jgi:glyoxylase-like metal-dependent hydrolase (beta-lactamase superfamily II)